MSTYYSGCIRQTGRKRAKSRFARQQVDRQIDLRTKLCSRAGIKARQCRAGAGSRTHNIMCCANLGGRGDRQVGMLSQQLGLGKIRDGLEIANRGPTGSYAVPGGAPTTIITLSSTCLANQIPDCASRVTPCCALARRLQLPRQYNQGRSQI